MKKQLWQYQALTQPLVTDTPPPPTAVEQDDKLRLGVKESVGVTPHPTVGGWVPW